MALACASAVHSANAEARSSLDNCFAFCFMRCLFSLLVLQLLRQSLPLLRQGLLLCSQPCDHTHLKKEMFAKHCCENECNVLQSLTGSVAISLGSASIVFQNTNLQGKSWPPDRSTENAPKRKQQWHGCNKYTALRDRRSPTRKETHKSSLQMLAALPC